MEFKTTLIRPQHITPKWSGLGNVPFCKLQTLKFIFWGDKGHVLCNICFHICFNHTPAYCSFTYGSSSFSFHSKDTAFGVFRGSFLKARTIRRSSSVTKYMCRCKNRCLLAFLSAERENKRRLTKCLAYLQLLIALLFYIYADQCTLRWRQNELQ